MIFFILEARDTDKDPIDRATKALFYVFEVWHVQEKRLSEWSPRAASVFHACQRDAGIAFPDVVKGLLVSTSLRAVGRSACTGAGTYRKQVRNCGNCNSVEIVFS